MKAALSVYIWFLFDIWNLIKSIQVHIYLGYVLTIARVNIIRVLPTILPGPLKKTSMAMNVPFQVGTCTYEQVWKCTVGQV